MQAGRFLKPVFEADLPCCAHANYKLICDLPNEFA
jgi:hypothetical protein